MALCPDCGALHPPADACPEAAPRPEAERPDPMIGQLLADRFRLTGRIGQGGMGVVYRAVHAVIGREVAVKVLHERHVDRPEVAARLSNEARLASGIRNEHIVDIFDFGQTPDGRTFIVMELLAGESLAALLRREGTLPARRVARLAAQVADALSAAHARGIIHRDVKPENVFVARDGEGEFVKVLDFGISKAMRGSDFESEPRLTETGVVLGTPLYMSPEQARGEEPLDPRVDVYALGVILYECLTGEVPFRGANYLGVIADVLSRTPPPMNAVSPSLRLSDDVERVVARAMARDRAARYPSMAALAADLRHIAAGEPVPLAPAAPGADAGAATFASRNVAASHNRPAAVRLRARKAVLYGAIASVAGMAALATVLVARGPGVAAGDAHAARRASPAGAPPASTAPASASPVASPTPVTRATRSATGLAGATPAAPRASTAPAPASTGLLPVAVRSRPPGAAVYLGERRLGTTPGVLALPSSDAPVRLTFKLPGREDAEALVLASEGRAVEVSLERPRSTRARTVAAPRRAEAGQEPLPVSRYPDDDRGARRGRN